MNNLIRITVNEAISGAIFLLLHQNFFNCRLGKMFTKDDNDEWESLRSIYIKTDSLPIPHEKITKENLINLFNDNNIPASLVKSVDFGTVSLKKVAC